MKRIEAMIWGALGAVITWLILTNVGMSAIKEGQTAYYKQGRIDCRQEQIKDK